MDLKKKKKRAGSHAKISDCFVTYLAFALLQYCGALIGCPDVYIYNISVVLFSCFKKFNCLGDVSASVSLPEFAKLRSQLLDVFIISSDFDLAQHFSCSVKTVECGQLFILACGQLRKKAQHNFIGQF